MHIVRARRFIAGYRDAFRDFTPNARRLLAAHALQNVALGIILIAFGLFVKAKTGSDAVLGGSEAAVSAALAVVCLVSAPLVTMIGYRNTLLIGAAAYAMARLGQASIPLVGPLLAFGFVGGVGEGINQAAVSPFLSENSNERHRDYLYSVDLFSRVGGSFLGCIVGGFLPTLLRLEFSQATAYQVTVFVAGLFYVASILPLRGISERVFRKPRHAWRRYYATVRGFSSWKHVSTLVIPQFTIAIGAGITMPFVSRYLQQEMMASDTAIGIIQGVTQLAIALAALSGPYLKRTLGVRWSMVLIQLSSLPFLVAIPFAPNLGVLAPILWARSALMNMSWPLFNQYSMHNIAPREKPIIGSSLAFSWAVGQIIGDVIGGFLMEAGLGSYAYFITAGVYFVGIIFMATMLTGDGSRPTPPVRYPREGEFVAEAATLDVSISREERF